MATYQDLSRLSTYNTQDRKVRPAGIVFHHTNSQTTNPGTIRILNERKNRRTGKPEPLGSNFVMDREGNIAYEVAPGAYAAHMRPSPDGSYANSNMLGFEVSAIDDSDMRQDQIDAAVKWAADTPNQRVALAHARLQPFAPTRMAMDTDYQTTWDQAHFRR